MSFLSSVLLLTVAAPLVYSLWRKPASHSVIPLPPGPKGYPVIGNVYDIPRQYAWLKYAEWTKKYGDVIYMNVFGAPTIVLNSHQAATELLDKRSKNYADRPDMIMATELMEWDWDFSQMRYSERWRRHRKLFHSYFQPRAVPAYQQIQLQATGNLLRRLLDSPAQFMSHVQHYSGSIILWIVYGHEIQPKNDYYVELVDMANRELGEAGPFGVFLVDYLPFLKYIPAWAPGAGFKKLAKKWAIDSNNVKNKPFEIVEKAMADGTAVPSFVKENLEKISSLGENLEDNKEIIKNCAGLAYVAGADTTVSVILTWMLAMSRYPDVFARAQAELNFVVGNFRLPTFQDRTDLPYLDAMLSETLRWYPATPQALPHRATAEDTYEGYYIPKGATVVPNVWAILHDEAIYQEPEKFKPERFLKQGDNELPPDPVTAGAFGFGRRVCPGRDFALNTAWIAIANILACFDISKPRSFDEKPFDLPTEYTGGLLAHPKPFPICLIPRSPDAIQLIINSTKEGMK